MRDARGMFLGFMRCHNQSIIIIIIRRWVRASTWKKMSARSLLSYLGPRVKKVAVTLTAPQAQGTGHTREWGSGKRGVPGRLSGLPCT